MNHLIKPFHLYLTSAAICLCCCFLTLPLHADSSLGPLGGLFAPKDGANYLEVTQLDSGKPGDLAGSTQTMDGEARSKILVMLLSELNRKIVYCLFLYYGPG